MEHHPSPPPTSSYDPLTIAVADPPSDRSRMLKTSLRESLRAKIEKAKVTCGDHTGDSEGMLYLYNGIHT